MTTWMRLLSAGVLATAVSFDVTGCSEQKGPMEEAGERMDDALDEAGDAIEDAGDTIKEKTDN